MRQSPHELKSHKMILVERLGAESVCLKAFVPHTDSAAHLRKMFIGNQNPKSKRKLSHSMH